MDGEVQYNLDKRTQRLVDSAEFKAALVALRAKIASEGPGFLRHPSKAEATSAGDGVVRVLVRKRPLFDYEVHDKGQYDVVTAVCDDASGSSGVLVSQCRQKIMPRRGIVRELGNYFYPCDCVFDEAANNEQVYQESARPLLELASQGGIATAFMFGQTGSGKTHTMSSIQKAVARDVFTLPAARERLELVFFELLGSRCLDLLHAERSEVKLLADAKGNTNVAGATRLDLASQSPAALLDAMAEALRCCRER
jgi:kinesin family protein 2/24